MLTCPNCGRKNTDDARFCSGCATALAPAAPQAEVRKTVTVLFTDVTGSTSLGERLDPEALRRVMARYFDRMQEVVERHGGTVEKFIGDAVMAVFGVPTLHEDDALRAVRAAVDMREALASLNKELERDLGVTIAIRTGVNTGEVVAGDPSTGQRLATGDAVNVAARLEQAAQPGQILIGEQTFRLARAAVVVDDAGPIALKGKELPVRAYHVLEVAQDVEGFERRLDSPMVGRDDELAMLEGAFRRASRERIALLFTVLGSAGVGKSRLVQEFVASVGDHATVVRGRCLAYGEGITYWPVAEVVKQAAGITEHDPPDEALDRIAALLGNGGGVGAGAGTIAATVGEAIGVVDGSAPAEEIAWAVRRLLEAMARETPVVAILDDIHWAEPTLLDLIEHVSDWSRDSPLLLLCLARQELLDARPAWGGGKLNASTIQLEPLTADQSHRLVTHLLGESELDERTRRRLTEAAEGNPLFVEQMVAMLIDDGLLVRRDGQWIPVGPMPEVAVPPTIHALVAARLDRLGPEERAVIERGAVEGKVFHVGAVAALGEQAGAQVRRHLMALTRRELVRPERPDFEGEDAFRFRHQLIRDATYRAIPKETRAELHERFARWLSGKAGDRLVEYEEILGYHLEQAHRYRRELGHGDELTRELAARASALLAASGRRARARQDWAAAAKLLSRARDVVPPSTAEFVEVSLDLAEALEEAGEFDLSQEAAHRAVDAAEDLRDELLLARARVVQLLSRAHADPQRFIAEGAALLPQVIPVLEAAGDDRGLARAWKVRVELAHEAADRTAMDQGLARILEHARRAGDAATVTRTLVAWVANTYWGPMPADVGLRRADDVLRELEEVPTARARVRYFQAGLVAMQGRFDEARGILAEAAEVFREHGERLYTASFGFVAGPLEMWAGDPAAAERELRANCEALEAMGERAWLCSIACYLAEALYRQHKDDEAEAWVDRARGWSPESDLEAQSDWRSIEGKLLARRGEHEQAEALVREGLAISERTDEIDHIGDSWADVAEVLRLAGRTADAEEAARTAVAWYERKGNLAEAANVRRAFAR